MENRIDEKNGGQPVSSRSAIDVGRQLLEDWETAQPENFFSSDVSFQRSLEYLWGRNKYKEHAARLYKFGADLATDVDGLVRESNLDENYRELHKLGLINSDEKLFLQMVAEGKGDLTQISKKIQ